MVFITVHCHKFLPFNLHILPSDPFLISFFEEKCDNVVIYIMSSLNGLLLYKPAIVYRECVTSVQWLTFVVTVTLV